MIRIRKLFDDQNKKTGLMIRIRKLFDDQNKKTV